MATKNTSGSISTREIKHGDKFDVAITNVIPDVGRVIVRLSNKKSSAEPLRKKLERCSEEIGRAAMTAEAMPRRRVLREKLATIANRANELRKLIRDPDIINSLQDRFIYAVGDDRGFNADIMLSRLSCLANEAMPLVEDGPGSQNSAPGLGYIDAKLLCASVIVQAWRQINGREPGSETGNAQLACAELWRAAGQKDLSKVEDSDVSAPAWKRHLASARTTNTKPPASWISGKREPLNRAERTASRAEVARDLAARWMKTPTE
jgi:hypothetical protein